jgi:hypothetical protein
MSAFVLTDAAIERALAPGLDVGPPVDFTRNLAAAVAAQPRRSRSLVLGWIPWPRQSPIVMQALLLMLLCAGADHRSRRSRDGTPITPGQRSPDHLDG